MAIPYHIVGAEVVVMNDEQQILLIKDPIRGWELPGGQVEKGESIKQAAIREVKEETGIEVELIKFCGVNQNLARDICHHLFLAKPVAGSLTTSVESEEVGYFPLEQALDLIARDYVRNWVLYCLDASKQPFLLEMNN